MVKSMKEIKARTAYENEYTNLYIFSVVDGIANFIEGISPSAIHDMQSIPVENLISHIDNWGFTFSECLTEAAF